LKLSSVAPAAVGRASSARAIQGTATAVLLPAFVQRNL
jgi:hypothetical protein